MRSDIDTERVLDIHRKMVDKTVRVLEGSYSWIGKVVEIVDSENFLIKRNRESDPKQVNMFDIRSL
jgi:hypothetical protein